METRTTVYKFTFNKILRGGQQQLFLDFPGRYGRSHGPFKNREAAWQMFVRILRECHFLFEPEPDKEVVYEEQILIPGPYVPPTDFQI